MVRQRGARAGRVFPALGIVAALGACNAAQTPLGEAPVDQSYRIRYLDGRKDADPYQLFVFVKAEPLDGKLRVCGAYLADMSDARFAHYSAAFHDMQSYLRFGDADKRRQVVRPGFLSVTRAPVPTGPDGRPRLPRELAANCVATEAAWDDSYALEPFTLDLRETRIRSLFLPYR
jgi:hypothetical protein